MDAGVHEALPVKAILRDAANMHVPVYDFPFVHEQLYAWGAARSRIAIHIAVSRATGEWRSSPLSSSMHADHLEKLGGRTPLICLLCGTPRFQA